jgi:two-component system chemotaxis response regulator CheB
VDRTSGRDLRVLIVDDSAVARQAVGRAIRDAGGMEVVGLAGNGRSGLEQVRLSKPDVVVLDLEMPEMGGLEFLRRLRRFDPSSPVVVFSALTAEGAAATMAAMSAGATAFALKPSALRGSAEGSVETELVPLLRALAPKALAPPARAGHAHPGQADAAGAQVGKGRTSEAVRRKAGASAASAPGPAGRPAQRPEIVVVGVSTGGPNALATLVAGLPGDLPVPILVVQHMPPVFTGLLADRLDGHAALHVSEAGDGMPLAGGSLLIAPGGHHLAVGLGATGLAAVLNDDPPENSCRPAADVLFRSAARHFGPRVLAVVMTGMGSDGLRGARDVVAAGGRVIVQDPATAVVSSMPAAVRDAGLADGAWAVPDLAAEIVRRVDGGGS